MLIGHDSLKKRHESARLEIRRLRDSLRIRDATIAKLRKQLAEKQSAPTVIITQRQRHCGCRHCIEVANRRNQ